MSALLQAFEHRADRESLPSWSWLTGDGWPHGTPLILTVKSRPPEWQGQAAGGSDAAAEDRRNGGVGGGPPAAPPALRAGSGEPPPAVVALFDAVAKALAAGFYPRPGAMLELGGDAFPSAIVFAPALDITNVPVPKNALAMLALHPAEVAAIPHVGKTRLLSHLGWMQGTSQFPRVSDWRRAPVADRLGVALTKIKDTRTVMAPDWCLISRGQGLTIRVLEGSTNGAADVAALAGGEVVTFLTDPAWDTPAAHPWPPPPQERERPAVLGAWSTPDAPAGGAQGSSPAFLSLARDETDGVSNVEDGLLLKLKPATLGQLADALKRFQRLDLEFPDRTVFRVRWAARTSAPVKIADKDLPPPERAPVPLPSPTFASPGNWQTFTTPFVKAKGE